MSAQNPTSAGGPLLQGPSDPWHDPTAAYALEPDDVAKLTRRLVATSGQTVEVRTPLNGAPLAHIPQSTAADVNEAFNRARKAQLAWARTSIDERAEIMLRLHDLILDRRGRTRDLLIMTYDAVAPDPPHDWTARLRRAGVHWRPAPDR